MNLSWTDVIGEIFSARSLMRLLNVPLLFVLLL